MPGRPPPLPPDDLSRELTVARPDSDQSLPHIGLVGDTYTILIAGAADLPPAYIEVGQLDIFRDENVRYALTLSQAGVPVELHLHPGAPHEYDAIAPGADVSRRAQGDRDRVLRSL